MAVITPLAPDLPHWGLMAHCDASVLPLQEFLNDCEQVIRHSRNRRMPWWQRLSSQERYDVYQMIFSEKNNSIVRDGGWLSTSQGSLPVRAPGIRTDYCSRNLCHVFLIASGNAAQDY